MAPPRAKRSRQNGEETSVAREETEQTSPRRTRSARNTMAEAEEESVDSSVIEAISISDVAESSGTRRITRASRGRGSAATSARTRPFDAVTFAEHSTAATQTDHHIIVEEEVGMLGDPEWERRRWERILAHGRRTSSNGSVAGSPSTPELSDDEVVEEEVDVVADPPRERRAATQRALESLAEQQPQPAVRPTRAAAVRARDATNRDMAAARAASGGRAGRVSATTSRGRLNVDVVGVIEEIMGHLDPGILDSFIGGNPREFLRDSSTGRLDLVQRPEPVRPTRRILQLIGDMADPTDSTIREGTDATASAAAVVVPRPHTVTTVRMDLQIDMIPEGGSGDGPPTFDFDAIRRITDAERTRRTVEQAARIRLDQLTPQEVNHVVHRVMLECEQAATRQNEARNREMAAAARAEREAIAARAEARAARAAEAQAAAAAAARAGEAVVSVPVEEPDEDEEFLREATEAFEGDIRFIEMAQAARRQRPRPPVAPPPPPPPPPPVEPVAPAAPEVSQPRTRARTRRAQAAAAALTLSEVGPAPSPPADMDGASDDSSSSSTSPTPPEEPPTASLSSQRILADIRHRVINELRSVRHTRVAAASAPPPPPPVVQNAPFLNAVGTSWTRADPTPRSGVELVGMELVAPSGNLDAPLEALRNQLMPPFVPSRNFPPRRPDDEITTNRLREFIMYLSGQASDNGRRRLLTAHFGGGPIDYRLRSIMNSCNIAIAALVRRENRAETLAALLRGIVENVNNVDRDPVERRIGRNGESGATTRLVTFHVRPLTTLQGAQIRTVFSDLIADGRGDPDPSELRLREQEDKDESEESAFKSSEWGECRICMADEPCNPMGCKFCRQMVGCNKCCNRWHRAGRRPTSSIIDTLFASFRADRERFSQIDQLRRLSVPDVVPMAIVTSDAPPAVAASTAPVAASSGVPAAASSGAGDATSERVAVSSALRSSLLSGAWESNCPLCRKGWKSKPQVVAMQRCLPLGMELAEEDRVEDSPDAVEAVPM